MTKPSSFWLLGLMIQLQVPVVVDLPSTGASLLRITEYRLAVNVTATSTVRNDVPVHVG